LKEESILRIKYKKVEERENKKDDYESKNIIEINRDNKELINKEITTNRDIYTKDTNRDNNFDRMSNRDNLITNRDNNFDRMSNRDNLITNRDNNFDRMSNRDGNKDNIFSNKDQRLNINLNQNNEINTNYNRIDNYTDKESNPTIYTDRILSSNRNE